MEHVKHQIHVMDYQRHLTSDNPAQSGFQAITLDNCLDGLDAIGAGEIAAQLRSRYLDFTWIDRVVFGD